MKKALFLILLTATSFFALAQEKSTTIVVDASHLRTTINKNIYGQFSEHLGWCIYGGIWVGENSTIPNTRGIRNDVVAALRKIKVPILRWPGGCFADEYHWKDGIGPRHLRPSMVNTNWGGVTEDNAFGTHEFMDLCAQIGCEPYFTGNVGSGSVQELSQWVEYVNSDNVSPLTAERKVNGRDTSWGVKYWAVGNESWGCGGSMQPAYYADLFRRYSTFMRTYGKNGLYRIACGPSEDNYVWTDVLMKNAGRLMNGLAMHYYASSGERTATDFTEGGWFDILKKSLRMEDLVTRHSAIMDKYDPGKRVGLIVDEWGTWYKVEPGTNPGFLFQQNTMRDAVAAACNLNIFNNHSDRVRMANIAQVVNVLQAMVLTDKEKMIVTPTYHVFDLYTVHQDAKLVSTTLTTPPYVYGTDSLPSVSASASIDRQGRMHISMTNLDPHASQAVTCTFKKFHPTSETGRLLAARTMDAHNTFSAPGEVTIHPFTDVNLHGDNLVATLPPMSVVTIELNGHLDLAPATTPHNLRPGLSYKYYEGEWNVLPAFASLTPKRAGLSATVTLPEPNTGEYFGVLYEGYVSIPADGAYTFYLTSDDGGRLVIDGEIVADNDGKHAPSEVPAETVLKSGYHSLRVEFFQGNGGKALSLDVEGPGLKRQPIPASLLVHEEK